LPWTFDAEFVQNANSAGVKYKKFSDIYATFVGYPNIFNQN